MSASGSQRRVVEIGAADLPLHCPPPGASVWNAHPRVFLPVELTGEARCPYCGTLYRLKQRDGQHSKRH